MFNVFFLKGDYLFKQQQASKLKLDLYLEYHFNFYSKSSNYTLVKVPHNYKEDAVNFGIVHSSLINKEFGIPLYVPNAESPVQSKGVLVCKKRGRTDFNISQTTVPSAIIEPFFLSNPKHVSSVLANTGKLADILTEALNIQFADKPDAKIGLSVGHKYRKACPNDRGSSVVGKVEHTEADIADTIITMGLCKLMP